MSPPVEVIRKVQREAVAQVPLDAEVRLLRISIDKILGLRITEGLEAERQERRIRRVEVQVVLVEKLRLRKVEGLELLLVGQVAEVGVHSRDLRWRALRLIQQSLENGECVQIRRAARDAAIPSANKGQLPAR